MRNGRIYTKNIESIQCPVSIPAILSMRKLICNSIGKKKHASLAILYLHGNNFTYIIYLPFLNATT